VEIFEGKNYGGQEVFYGRIFVAKGQEKLVEIA
jgi:hypothetical protein